MELLELASKLIKIQSLTGKEENMMVYLAEYLEKLGFSITRQMVDSSRFNVLAKIGEPRVILSSHADTVPPYVPFREDERYLYGRGACDTKGIIAAMLKASEALIEEGIRDFGLLFMVGEESTSDGAMAADTIPNTCRWLINGEPTSNRMALGTKGAVKVKLTITGKACHSAYPEQGESAIHNLLDILDQVRQHNWPVFERLGETTFNIGVISGGTQPNMLAPKAEAQLMFRVVTSSEDIKKRLETIVGDRGELDFYFSCEPINTFALEGFETMIAAYRTDIPFLTHWGTPLLFGPGTILDAHSAGEKISKTEMRDAVNHYIHIVRTLLNR